MANLNLSEFTEKLFVADADHTFIWDTAASISKRVSRNSWLSGTTADFHLGLADAATAVAQTLSVQSVVAGTTNTAGANFTIDGSKGTGTGAGGKLIFRVARAGTSGSTQNILTEGLSIDPTIHPNGGLGISSVSGNNLFLYYPGNGGIFFGDIYSNIYGGFSGIGNFRIGNDAFLLNEATNTLALRNGAVAQTFNVYGTYTSGTSYERLTLSAPSAANAIIGTNKGSGGGTARGLDLHTDGAARMTITTAGNVGIGTTSPTSKLQVSAGDVEVDTIAKGVILKSPDGTRYRVTVANGGTLSVAAV